MSVLSTFPVVEYAPPPRRPAPPVAPGGMPPRRPVKKAKEAREPRLYQLVNRRKLESGSPRFW